MQPSDRTPRGEIFDLGYQRYSGPRLGRGYAMWSLYTLSVRNAFGIGRGALPKILAFTLLVLAYFPALLQVAIGVILPVEDFDFVTPDDYYGFIQVIIVLFVAAVATDLVGNDERNRTLPLYFSRPLLRDDYALVKLGALATVLLTITVAPQLLMFVGNALGAANGFDYIKDNARDIPAILASGVLLCLMFAGLGILIAAYAERRSFAIVTIFAAFLISLSAIQIVISLADNDLVHPLIFLSPVHVMQGFTAFLFDATVFGSGEVLQNGGPNEQVAFVDYPGILYVVAALVYTAITAWLSIRHYRKAF